MNINNPFLESNQMPINNTENKLTSTAVNREVSTRGNQDKVRLGKEPKSQNSSLEERKKSIIDTIEKASGKIEVESKGLEFSIHKETNQIMIKVIDNNTHEVVKEVPSEKILDMMAKILKLSGNFLDERR